MSYMMGDEEHDVDGARSDDPTLLQIRYAQEGDYRSAARAQRWALWVTGFGELPGAIARLVELDRLGGAFDDARTDLDRSVRALALLREFGPNDNYRHQRGKVIEEGFLLAAADPDVVRAAGALDLVEALATDVSLSARTLAAGLSAARHIGDHDRAAHWTRRIEEGKAMRTKWAAFQKDEDDRVDRMRSKPAVDE